MRRNYPRLYSVTLIAVIGLLHFSAADAQKAAPIPAEINNILSASCTPCHFEGGKMLALSMVNLSKWTEYSAAKGSKKAGMISYVLKKGKMPPKKIRRDIPEMIPSKEQADLIIKWADSLREKK